jgi:hypothetical protein
LKIKNGGLKEKIVEGHQFAKQEENIPQHKWLKRILVLLKWFGMKHSMTNQKDSTSVEGQVLQNFLMKMEDYQNGMWLSQYNKKSYIL